MASGGGRWSTERKARAGVTGTVGAVRAHDGGVSGIRNTNALSPERPQASSSSEHPTCGSHLSMLNTLLTSTFSPTVCTCAHHSAEHARYSSFHVNDKENYKGGEKSVDTTFKLQKVTTRPLPRRISAPSLTSHTNTGIEGAGSPPRAEQSCSRGSPTTMGHGRVSDTGAHISPVPPPWPPPSPPGTIVPPAPALS